MKKKIKNFKTDFFTHIEKHNFPTYNKATLLTFLCNYVVRNPTDPEAQELFLTFLSGYDFLLPRFAPSLMDESLMDKYLTEEYKNYRRIKSSLKKAISNEARFIKEWEYIKSRKSLPAPKALPARQIKECQQEAEALQTLYLTYFPASEKNCPELYWNLYSFCEASRAFPSLHKIAPFFFYQIMVRHTSRLARTKCFRFSLKGLWDYKEYNICHDNGKNYAQYRTYAKLFLALCRLYRKDITVDIPLCRYAYPTCSNMLEWLYVLKPGKAHKFTSKLDDMLRFHAYCCESYAPDKYFFMDVYGVTDEEFDRYVRGRVGKNEPDYSPYFEKAREALTKFFDEENDILWYKLLCNIYYDAEAVRKIVQTYYDKAGLDEIYPDEVPMKLRLSETHHTLESSLNDALLSFAEQAIHCIIENNNI